MHGRGWQRQFCRNRRAGTRLLDGQAHGKANNSFFVKKVKIGLLNFHFENDNYGAVLQAYALALYLKHLGNQVVIIDLVPHTYRVTTWKGKTREHLERIFRLDVFERFRHQWPFEFTKKVSHIPDIRALGVTEFDAIVVGSDQVWRPGYTEDRALLYFLSFVPPQIKRIAYAASFGVGDWIYGALLTQQVASELTRFHAISVRESSGVDICSNIFALQSTHVLDPTLLVGREYFDPLISDVHLNPHIAYCQLDNNANFKKSIKYLQSHLGFPAKNIYRKEFRFNRRVIKQYLPVKTWLEHIRDSSLVVTDSYHCICLAILFRKQFLCYPNQGRGVARLESLLQMLGLQNRVVRSFEELKHHDLANIDYNRVEMILSLKRQQSSRFLTDALAFTEDSQRQASSFDHFPLTNGSNG